MKYFVSFTMKIIHPFDVSSIEIDLFLFKLAICELLPVKTQNRIVPNECPNILISMPPENFSPFYPPGFQLNPGKINI